MAGNMTSNTEHLTRSQLWSNQLKEYFEDALFAQRWVDWITDFPDGDVINIPSIGQAEVQEYDEGRAITYNKLATGNFQFRITEYKASAYAISRKMMQDSFYASRVVSAFVPKMQRALMKAVEVDVLKVINSGQTSGDQNRINGASHRWVGQGTNQVISVEDFAVARYALQKANVPMTNLVAIVDPSVEYTINTLSNIVNVSNNPRWEGIIGSGIGDATGMQFIANIYGFDVYVSQNLPTVSNETINGTSVTDGVVNYMFSADSTALPIVGNIRQAPIVDSEFNKDLQQEEYVTTSRWGFGFYRPENAISVLTSTNAVPV